VWSPAAGALHDGAVVRLIGRGREVAALEAAVARAVLGSGGVAVVCGEPGIGKTTLVREIARATAARGVAMLWGRGVESAPVYWPWLQVLRDRGDAVGDAALRCEVGSGADVMVRVAPDLASRLGVASRSAAGGDEGDRVRLFDAFERWLRAAAAGSGLLVVLDDMHWADRGSVRLLEHVAQGLAASRTLVLAAYRSTERGDGDVVGGPRRTARGHPARS
jgi:predicted ATPase